MRKCSAFGSGNQKCPSNTQKVATHPIVAHAAGCRLWYDDAVLGRVGVDGSRVARRMERDGEVWRNAQRPKLPFICRFSAIVSWKNGKAEFSGTAI